MTTATQRTSRNWASMRGTPAEVAGMVNDIVLGAPAVAPRGASPTIASGSAVLSRGSAATVPTRHSPKKSPGFGFAVSDITVPGTQPGLPFHVVQLPSHG